MKHYYPHVPTLGNVVLSRHAQARAAEFQIGDEMVKDALDNGTSIPDQPGIIFREKGLVRLVIVERPHPFNGAKLVKTIIKLQPQIAAQ